HPLITRLKGRKGLSLRGATLFYYHISKMTVFIGFLDNGIWLPNKPTKNFNLSIPKCCSLKETLIFTTHQLSKESHINEIIFIYIFIYIIKIKLFFIIIANYRLLSIDFTKFQFKNSLKHLC